MSDRRGPPAALGRQAWQSRWGSSVPAGPDYVADAVLRAGRKPAGLWTSTWHPEAGSDWMQWCCSQGFSSPPFDVWLLEALPSARLYVVDSYADLERLVALSPGPSGATPEWGPLAAMYDGIHLTHAGQWATRLSGPLDLYGWDCESTCWFRDVFTAEREHIAAFTPSRRDAYGAPVGAEVSA